MRTQPDHGGALLRRSRSAAVAAAVGGKGGELPEGPGSGKNEQDRRRGVSKAAADELQRGARRRSSTHDKSNDWNEATCSAVAEQFIDAVERAAVGDGQAAARGALQRRASRTSAAARTAKRESKFEAAARDGPEVPPRPRAARALRVREAASDVDRRDPRARPDHSRRASSRTSRRSSTSRCCR